MNRKHFLNLGLLALLSSFITLGCNSTTIPEDLGMASPAFAPDNPDEQVRCNEIGNAYHFDALFDSFSDPLGTSIPSGLTYSVYLGTTPPYRLGRDCVCKVKYYTIEFDYLPSSGTIKVEDHSGNPVPFIGPLTSASTTNIQISENHLSTGVYIGFNPGINPIPEIAKAGGFCIVDNISGPAPATIQTAAFVEFVYQEETNTDRKDIFLPVSAMRELAPL